MYIALSQFSLETLLLAAATRSIPTAEEIEVDVFWVAPDEDVEIWDRISEPLPQPNLWVYSEYAGETPELHQDGRRYRKSFDQGPGEARTVVTFASSIYRLRPVTVVLQGKRIGQTSGPESALFTLFVCDRDNRQGFPAYLSEFLEPLEEEEALQLPLSGDRERTGTQQPFVVCRWSSKDPSSGKNRPSTFSP